MLSLPTGKLSYSQIDDYLRCPAQYEFHYVLGKKKPHNIYLAEGSIWAKLIEFVGKQMIKGKVPDVAKIWTQFQRFAKQELGKVKVWHGVTRESVLNRGKHFTGLLWGVLDLRKEDKSAFNFKPVAVEEEFSIAIQGIPVSGVLDLREEDAIWDFKVAGRAQNYDPGKSLQLDLYRYATNTELAGFAVLEKTTGKFIRRKKKRKMSDVRQRCEYVVTEVAKAISAGCFPPRDASVNPLCNAKFCPFYSKCKAGRAL